MTRFPSKCKDWLQPVHYQEVVKERAHEGRCGYPCCDERIKPPRVDLDELNAEDSLNPGKVMKIDLSKNRILELGVEDRARFYYCTRPGKECMGRSKAFVEGMDSTIPASRPAAYELDLSQASGVGGSAADVLKALSLATDSAALAKSPTKKGKGGIGEIIRQRIARAVASRKRAKAGRCRENRMGGVQGPPASILKQGLHRQQGHPEAG